MLLPLRHSRGWLVLGWIFVALAVIVSIIPAQRLPQPPGVNDKVEHMVGYMLLALWFAGIYPRSRYVIIAISLFAMGALVEFAQSAMHVGRHGDWRDMIANCAGIASGLTMAFFWLGGWAQRIEALTRKP